MKNLTSILLLSILLWSCGSQKESTETETETEKRTQVEMVTDFGTMVIELYNETPKHRDNFIKLANEGFYDSLLFHRVIKQFMVQGGDPNSKNAEPDQALGNGDLEYTVDAEFNPNLFHKKGAIAAARDGNAARASSSTQFYLVQGKVFNDSLLNQAETRINGWLKDHYSRNHPTNKALSDSMQKAIDNENIDLYRMYNDSLRQRAEGFDDFEKYAIPEGHREVYRTLGGTPHLDQNYTVYGEVVEGLNIIDSIAAVQTGMNDRPESDVRIISVTVKQ